MKQIPKERNVSCVAHPEKASVDLTDTIWREEMALVKVGQKIDFFVCLRIE